MYSKQTEHSNFFKGFQSSWLSETYCVLLPSFSAKRYEKENSKLLRHTYILGRHETPFPKTLTKWLWKYPLKLLKTNIKISDGT
jgi:hypothetical protein